MWRLQLTTDNTPENHFINKHPKNTTLFAIYVTTLVMYILYRLPRRGVAVLLAGMRSILKSELSLAPLATEVPKDPRRLLTLYHLDPVTQNYICCPACYHLYPHSVVKAKKRKASTFSSELPGPMENTNHGDASEDAPLVPGSTPAHCIHRRIHAGASCGEPLFDSVTINGNTYVVPRFKYHAQDLKQWIGWLLSRPNIEEAVFKAFRRPRKERMEDMWDAGHLCKVLLKKGK
jgi:hypothetical protein